jgi:hypothetical protein
VLAAVTAALDHPRVATNVDGVVPLAAVSWCVEVHPA